MRAHGRTKYLIERCRCEICTEANAEYSRRYRQKKRKRKETPTVTIQPIDDERWRQHAACKHHPRHWWFDDEQNRFATAKAICKTCPVRTECLNYALSLDNMHGIWGGTTSNERRTIKKRLKAQ